MTKPDKIFLQLVFLQLCRNLSPTLGQGLDDVGGLSGQQAVAERLAQVVRRVIAWKKTPLSHGWKQTFDIRQTLQRWF